MNTTQYYQISPPASSSSSSANNAYFNGEPSQQTSVSVKTVNFSYYPSMTSETKSSPFYSTIYNTNNSTQLNDFTSSISDFPPPYQTSLISTETGPSLNYSKATSSAPTTTTTTTSSSTYSNPYLNSLYSVNSSIQSMPRQGIQTDTGSKSTNYANSTFNQSQLNFNHNQSLQSGYLQESENSSYSQSSFLNHQFLPNNIYTNPNANGGFLSTSHANINGSHLNLDSPIHGYNNYMSNLQMTNLSNEASNPLIN